MSFIDLFSISLWATIIEFLGALLIISYIVLALVTLLRTGNVHSARLQVAAGVITGLSFKLAGTLLKTIELQTWHQIFMFIAIFALRIILKRFFNWEQNKIQQEQSDFL